MTSPDRDGKIFVGKGAADEFLSLALANRHGLVTGATGTGKTVSLQVLAEGFSRAGVPVFAADIKGDLSGIAARGEARPEFVKRAKDLGFDYTPRNFPSCSGICSASRAIRSAPRCSRWGRCWSRACSTQRRAGRHHQHRLPLCRRRSGIEGGATTSTDLSISRICASCCRTCRRTPRRSAPATATSR
jgi:hypothetical protein